MKNIRELRVGLAILLVIGTAVVITRSRSTSELLVEGRSLSEWLAIAADGSSQNKAAQTNAQQVIRNLGSAAVPFLLKQLETPPGWREKFGPVWNRFAMNRGWWNRLVDVYRANKTREVSLTGFEILGTNAATAVPKLRELARDQRYARDVADSLGYIQTEQSLDLLIELIKSSDPRVRFSSVYSIMHFENRERVARAVDAVIPLTDDADEETARAAIALATALLPANRAIPLLTNKFHDPRPVVTRRAVGEFIFAGPVAEPLMPIIAMMLTNADENTRRIATNALITINPYRAPEFGVITNQLEGHVYKTYHRIREQYATNKSSYLH